MNPLPSSSPRARSYTSYRRILFKSQLHHALWPHPRGQAELVHFGEVRLRRPLGNWPGSPSFRFNDAADHDWYGDFLHADGTRQRDGVLIPEQKSGTRRSQTA